jgi:hypothetical protein
MLIFLDETFRTHAKGDVKLPFGALCGVAIPENQFTRIAKDIYQLKMKHLGAEFARDHELKGKELLKNYVFKLQAKGIESKNLSLAGDILDYLDRKGLRIFGCVCFQPRFQDFKCQDVTALDKTFRYLFERIDMFMKIERPQEKAVLVFDDRDQGTNERNATAITNFFLRSPDGLALDSIIDTPFFGISQAQNIGLQLADFVTTIIGLRFEGHEHIKPYFERLKRCVHRWQHPGGRWNSSLKIIRPLKKESAGRP